MLNIPDRVPTGVYNFNGQQMFSDRSETPKSAAIRDVVSQTHVTKRALFFLNERLMLQCCDVIFIKTSERPPTDLGPVFLRVAIDLNQSQVLQSPIYYIHSCD